MKINPRAQQRFIQVVTIDPRTTLKKLQASLASGYGLCSWLHYLKETWPRRSKPFLQFIIHVYLYMYDKL